MSIAENRLGFLVTEAILTHTDRSIQWSMMVALPWRNACKTLHLPLARRSSIPTIDPV